MANFEPAAQLVDLRRSALAIAVATRRMRDPIPGIRETIRRF